MKIAVLAVLCFLTASCVADPVPGVKGLNDQLASNVGKPATEEVAGINPVKDTISIQEIGHQMRPTIDKSLGSVDDTTGQLNQLGSGSGSGGKGGDDDDDYQNYYYDSDDSSSQAQASAMSQSNGQDSSSQARTSARSRSNGQGSTTVSEASSKTITRSQGGRQQQQGSLGQNGYRYGTQSTAKGSTSTNSGTQGSGFTPQLSFGFIFPSSYFGQQGAWNGQQGSCQQLETLISALTAAQQNCADNLN